MRLSALGDFDVPDLVVGPVVSGLQSSQVQTQLYGIGRDLVRAQLHMSRGPSAPTGHPNLNKLVGAVTDPLVRGVRDEVLPWAVGALAVAGLVGYALGRR